VTRCYLVSAVGSGHNHSMRSLYYVFVAALVACGGSPKTTTGPEAPEVKDEPVVGPPQVAWKDMTKEQQGHYMAKVVVPKMKPLFVAFSDKDFGKDFGCKTCHGEAAEKTHKFDMPNAGIFVLPATMPEFEALGKDKPEYMKFMATQVEPEMATLLGLEKFDPANPKPGTFGCLACHTQEKPKA
jgi:hypothetical protein